MGPKQHAIQEVQVAIFPWVKQSERVADQSPPFNAKVKSFTYISSFLGIFV
jgi:hypothetical protein